MYITTAIVENFTLSDLKTFLVEQDLNTKYKCTPQEQYYFMLYTTLEGLDKQTGYESYPVEAKVWIQYFPVTDVFALNINFFSSLDGAPIGAQDFIAKAPDATRQYEYYNGLKVRWVKENDIYIKEVPINFPYPTYPGFDNISPK